MFPEGEVPAPMPSSGDTLEAVGVPLAQFMPLTRIPITIVYGDNIPDRPVANPGQDQWRTRLADGSTVGGRGEPPRWKGHCDTPAGLGHPRQHALSFL